jgi:hypothetical protein
LKLCNNTNQSTTDLENDLDESPCEASPETNLLRRQVKNTSEQVLKAVVDAISTDGHGYAFPLEITICVGSEFGCHRSVVYSELLAQALRASLRLNRDGSISQPVSVETIHRDIDRRCMNKSDEMYDRKKRDNDNNS